jgi:shikimate kinase
MRLVVVTGVSGAGKSTALRALEDLGYYCADNLPMPLLPKLVELLSTRAEIDRAGLVIDARGGEFLQGTTAILADIRSAGHSLEVLFLDAGDDILLRRFSETRRRHPLSDTDIRAGLRAERDQLTLLRQEASAVIDTGGLTVHLLRALIQERYGGAAPSSTRPRSCCSCRSRASGARASPTPPSPSGAPADVTGRWSSPRSSPSGCARTPPCRFRCRSGIATSSARAPLDHVEIDYNKVARVWLPQIKVIPPSASSW